MEAIGFDTGEAGQQAGIALLGVVIIFIVSPVGGYFLFKFIKRRTPMQDTFALLAAAFCLFLVSCALTLALLLRFTQQDESTFAAALLVSALVGGLVTAVTALVTVRFVERGKRKINIEDQTFGVWGGDMRKKPKNLRRR